MKWFSDSQTAVRIVQVGSMKRELRDLAIKIFQCCAENQIALDIQWLPRSDLERADYISRIVDVDDWQITNVCFEYIENLWGPHTVDFFANYYNKKVEKFFSRFRNPNSSGVDVFVQNVGNENCLVVPPVTMITKAIHYLYASRSVGTVIVPFWPFTRTFRDYVAGYEVFKGKWALRHGRNTNSLLGSEAFDEDVLALRMNFT